MKPDADLETYINLAVLYFVYTDFGYIAHHDLSKEFVETAWNRVNELLSEAEAHFGRHPEIEFWMRYFRFVVLGEEPFDKECVRCQFRFKIPEKFRLNFPECLEHFLPSHPCVRLKIRWDRMSRARLIPPFCPKREKIFWVFATP